MPFSAISVAPGHLPARLNGQSGHRQSDVTNECHRLPLRAVAGQAGQGGHQTLDP